MYLHRFIRSINFVKHYIFWLLFLVHLKCSHMRSKAPRWLSFQQSILWVNWNNDMLVCYEHLLCMSVSFLFVTALNLYFFLRAWWEKNDVVVWDWSLFVPDPCTLLGCMSQWSFNRLRVEAEVKLFISAEHWLLCMIDSHKLGHRFERFLSGAAGHNL